MDDRLAPQRLRELPSWLASRTALAGARVVEAQLAAAGLRRSHYALLVALREHGPHSQAELGRRLSADRSNLHDTVSTLEDDGLVAREPDPADARRKRVTLTRDGTRALRRLDRRVDAAQDELLAPLTAAERATLTELLARVVAHHAGS